MFTNSCSVKKYLTLTHTELQNTHTYTGNPQKGILTVKYDTKIWTHTHTHTCTHTHTHKAGLCSSWQPHLSSQYFLLFGLWVADPADFTGLCSLSRSILFNFIGAEASYYIIEFGLIMSAEQSSSTCDLLRRRANHLLQVLTYGKPEQRGTLR